MRRRLGGRRLRARRVLPGIGVAVRSIFTRWPRPQRGRQRRRAVGGRLRGSMGRFRPVLLGAIVGSGVAVVGAIVGTVAAAVGTVAPGVSAAIGVARAVVGVARVARATVG